MTTFYEKHILMRTNVAMETIVVCGGNINGHHQLCHSFVKFVAAVVAGVLRCRQNLYKRPLPPPETALLVVLAIHHDLATSDDNTLRAKTIYKVGNEFNSKDVLLVDISLLRDVYPGSQLAF
ncbi:hypothetical protein Tco_0085859 [Tanacetum coccineum]